MAPVNAVIGATIGVAVAAALLLLVAGLRRSTPASPAAPAGRPGAPTADRLPLLTTRWARLTRRPQGREGRRRDLWLVATVVLTLVAFLLTRLPVTLVAVPAVALLVPWLLSNPNAAGITVTAAIDQWVRSLRSLLLSGSDNTLEGALQSSLGTAPAPIRDQVRLLVARINSRWPTDRALAEFATELADPTGDVVAAALILAAQRRGAGLSEVLDGLATAVADDVRARRRIESERASARAAARYLTVIFAAMGIGLALLNPSYLEPYATPLGQLILLCCIGGFLAALWLVRRIATAKEQPRLLPRARESREVRVRA